MGEDFSASPPFWGSRKVGKQSFFKNKIVFSCQKKDFFLVFPELISCIASAGKNVAA
jgi:hypothetical protein